MRFCWFILLLFCVAAQAQVPRNASGLYEYASDITVSVPTDQLGKKVKKFFNTPFLVHWDSVGKPSTVNNTTTLQAKGHIKVGTRHRSIFSWTEIDVFLHASIEVKNGSYHYSFSHFVVEETPRASAFPLEQKPGAVRQLVYDQLLKKTHERITYVVGWLKGYMEQAESL
jgi:hypothetical protein